MSFSKNTSTFSPFSLELKIPTNEQAGNFNKTIDTFIKPLTKEIFFCSFTAQNYC